jgi:glycine/D-amino acid oxidase-like deaminating enzyme
VALLDAYGAGNSRSSSGGESRVLRMGYGSDEIYTRWAMRSRRLWTGFFERVYHPELFQPTGVLWTTPPGDPRAAHTVAAFEKCGVASQSLNPTELESKYPQIRFSSDEVGIFEPEGGALLARRAVQAVVQAAIQEGVDYSTEAALAPEHGCVKTTSGKELRAAVFVYACGPWLPKIFPGNLGGRIRPTRQEVFFFGTPQGDRRFAPPAMPVWIDFSDERRAYTLPDLEGRGFKLAFDRYGPEFDPDTGDRVATGLDAARSFLAERFPALASAPLLESRVCQYENTPTGDFLIDRHPGLNDVWLVGGGSGHGFKHGPAVGEYVTQLIDGVSPVEPRFSLASMQSHAKRAVH